MFRYLTIAALGLALAGCVQMQVNNAQVFADMAAQIAANCPAAAEEAKAAQDAATDAAQAAELMSFCSERAATLQAEIDYWNDQAAMHQAHAEAEHQRLQQLLGYRDQEEIVMSRRINSCDAAADCFGAKPKYGNCDSLISECGCSSVASCRAVYESIKDNLSSLQRDIREAAQAENDSLALAEQARDEASQLTGAEGDQIYYEGEFVYDDLPGMQQCMSNAATDLRVAEENAQKAAEDAAKACDVSLFGNAPPPDGTYPQDIRGSQNIGAGGSCSPGMAATCAGIQTQCIASCGPGGVGGCSPGAPAQCPACFAAGCI